MNTAAAAAQRTPTAGPRYLEIADDLRIDIETGRLKPGDTLPSTGELADRYGVSTAVTRQAIQLLKAQALVVTAAGRRPVVRWARSPKKYSNEAHWEKRRRIEWTEEKRSEHGTLEDESGLSIHGDAVINLPAVYTEIEADRRDIPEWPEGTPILKREYQTVTKQDQRWVYRSISYIPIRVIKKNPRLLDPNEEPWPGGIHHQLSTVGVLFGRFEDTVTVHVPTTVESERWGMSPGEPLLRVREIGWSEDDLEGQPVFINCIWYPAENSELKFVTDVPRRA